jgi:hypothetical protein
MTGLSKCRQNAFVSSRLGFELPGKAKGKIGTSLRFRPIECDAVQSGINLSTFLSNPTLPSSR